MKKPAYFAPLLALAAHIDHTENGIGGSLEQLPYFRSFAPVAEAADKVAGMLELSGIYANLLTTAGADRSGAHLIDCATTAVSYGLRAFLAAAGCPTSSKATVLREAGRMVVKNAFPRPLSYYSAGSMGDFSAHRLPLAGYKPGLHIASAEINTQAQLAAALRSARTRQALQVREQVQADPALAIRCTSTGKPLTKWSGAHWQEITWRLGYTTAFDLLAQAGELARAEMVRTPAPAELRKALERIVSYCSAVFAAYLPTPALALAA